MRLASFQHDRRIVTMVSSPHVLFWGKQDEYKPSEGTPLDCGNPSGRSVGCAGLCSFGGSSTRFPVVVKRVVVVLCCYGSYHHRPALPSSLSRNQLGEDIACMYSVTIFTALADGMVTPLMSSALDLALLEISARKDQALLKVDTKSMYGHTLLLLLA
ncbi:hypothetical protein Tco_1503895 [Tanacetum coccineum]